MFSVVIPTFNNLDYLKLCIVSLKKNSKLDYEIIVHVNEDSDGTRKYLDSINVKYSYSKKNVGLCTAINEAVKLTKFKYVVYSHDDVYFCPFWDLELKKEIDQINHNKFYLSCTLIERNSGHIKYDCGKDIKSFDEQKLLNNYQNINFYDHQGTHWSPLCVHIDTWNKIAGFSEEFNPGIGSDPDFNMKLWCIGVRIFKGINKFKVYHFGSLTTRKNANIKQNRGDNTFLKKWGFSIKFFKKFYMKTNTRYFTPLDEPLRNYSFFFHLILCKIKLLYLKTFNI
jgi:glycosyltransferase involved in cell wall biosynthesis